jgi:phosphate/sulfate permease
MQDEEFAAKMMASAFSRQLEEEAKERERTELRTEEDDKGGSRSNSRGDGGSSSSVGSGGVEDGEGGLEDGEGGLEDGEGGLEDGEGGLEVELSRVELAMNPTMMKDSDGERDGGGGGNGARGRKGKGARGKQKKQRKRKLKGKGSYTSKGYYTSPMTGHDEECDEVEVALEVDLGGAGRRGEERRGRPVPRPVHRPVPMTADEVAKVAFRKLLVVMAAMASFVHGANDTANATGAFSAVYDSYTDGLYSCGSSESSTWIMIMAGLFVALGVVTMGCVWPVV